MIFAGIANFRDVGAAEEDGPIRAGRLFRSAELSGATAGDVARLHALNIRTVIDLRRPAERLAAPTPDFGAAIIASDLDDRPESPHLAFLRSGVRDARAIDAYLRDYYRAAPFTAHNLALIGALLRHLMNSSGGVLVHCTAGKDRTGVAIAVVQETMAASRATIIADYLRSNGASGSSARREAAAIRLTALLGFPPPDAVLDALLSVQYSHLAIALDAIERQGGIVAYLDRVGFDRGDLDRLRRALGSSSQRSPPVR